MLQFLLVTLFVFMSIGVAAEESEYTPMPVDTAVLQGKLPNGLTYIIRKNKYPAERADFYIVQKVGAVQEEAHQNGLAHFLEHMAFNGTKNFPDKSLVDFLERVGVRYGENINAYTSYDETVYNLSNVPTTNAGIVDSALLVLHDWSGFISLEEEEIDKERGVIREEWRSGNTAMERMQKKHLGTFYAGTPYATHDIIGDTAVINNFKYDELRAYYKKWYRPDLQCIIVVGDIDPKAIEQKIWKMWEDIPAPVNPAERVYHHMQEFDKPVVSFASDPEAIASRIDIGYYSKTWPVELRNSVEGFAMGLTALVLGHAMTARLNDITARSDAPIIGSYCAFGREMATTYCFSLVVVAKDGHNREAFTLALDEAEKLRRYGLTAAEIERAKTAVLKEIADRYAAREKEQNNTYTQEYIEKFIMSETISAIEDEYMLSKALMDEIDEEMVKTFADQYLYLSPTIALWTPESVADSNPTAEELIAEYETVGSKELAAYEDVKFDGPIVDKLPKKGKLKKRVKDTGFGAEEWILSNGVRVLLKPTDYTDNEILLSARSLGGLTSVDTQEVVTATVIWAFTSEYGLGKYSKSDLNKMLVGKKVEIEPNVEYFYHTLDAKCSTDDFETLMQILYLSFGEPRHDEEAFDASFSLIESLVVNVNTDPEIAFDDTVTIILGNGNPYMEGMGRYNYKSITMQKTLDIYKRLYKNPKGFTFSIVGDFDIEAIKPHVLRWIGGMKTSGDEQMFVRRNIRYPKGTKEYRLERDAVSGKTSVLTLYSGAMPYTLRNDVKLQMLSELLSMQYHKKIREDEGGTYGVGCYSHLTDVGEESYEIEITYETAPELFDKLQPIVYREFENIAQNGPDMLDLQKVKEIFVKTNNEQQNTNQYWLDALNAKNLSGFDKHTEFQNLVKEITADEIKAMAAAIVAEKNRITISMSPKADMAAQETQETNE